MKKNKNANKLTLSGLLAAILACGAATIVIIFTVEQINGPTEEDSRINLNNEKIIYLAKVDHMASLTEEEATTIKSGIQEEIDEKMNNLNLEVNIDYTINNLDAIKSGVRLDSINISVPAVQSSTKARGISTVRLNGQENIDDRSIETIKIPANQVNGLTKLKATSIRNQIRTSVAKVLNEGQQNEEGLDYEIINLDSLIIGGAKLDDYKNQISVESTSKTTKLRGSFMINFEQETSNENNKNIK